MRIVELYGTSANDLADNAHEKYEYTKCEHQIGRSCKISLLAEHLRGILSTHSQDVLAVIIPQGRSLFATDAGRAPLL